MYRSLNTGKISRTRIGAACTEYADYLRDHEHFQMPRVWRYFVIAPAAPVVIAGTWWYSLWNDEPIQKVPDAQSTTKVQL